MDFVTGRVLRISTHAPRTGSDAAKAPEKPPEEPFQPTLPARGATKIRAWNARYEKKFQPTLPARGATNQLAVHALGREISTHAPRTGSDPERPQPADAHGSISTHAPRTGSDQGYRRAWRRRVQAISTHAPRTGSDRFVAEHPCPVYDFNPRSPHGERPDSQAVRGTRRVFQPTLPARGATGRR